MVKKSVIEDHVLLMKHIKLSEDEAKRLLNKYNIDKKQLPLIFDKDPAITGSDAMPGDIIEITRVSPTVRNSKYYRVVVNA